MGLSDEQAGSLNQILGIIDQKATAFKDNITSLSKAQAHTEKKLLFDLINDALELAEQIKPRPDGAIDDLYRLKENLNHFA